MVAYLATLTGKAAATQDAYRRALSQFLTWLAACPGCVGAFQPAYFTRTAVETYLAHLATGGYSLSHCTRLKTVLGSFARWLIEERSLLPRNPARAVALPAGALLAPRELTPDQRFVLHTLVERAGDPRSAALFALGYWAGCRVSDVSWLQTADVHLSRKQGWIHTGHKGGKQRDLDLHPQVRAALAAYAAQPALDPARPYFFPSQRADRLTEAGIHHWFRGLKALARKAEWDLIADLSFHDLRHDFAHRARAAGWALEEVAYYLGHVTKRGLPAIQTTARYTQVSRTAAAGKVGALRG